MEKRRWMVDSTLRDGEQRPGIVFSDADKVEIALRLDSLGVAEIEAAAAGAAAKDHLRFIDRILSRRRRAKVSVWSRMCEADLRQALASGADIVHIGAPVSDRQIYTKLKKNRSWVRDTVCHAVEMIEKEARMAVVGFEDASRANLDFMVELAHSIKECGSRVVRLSDTVGVLTPSKSAVLTTSIHEATGMEIEVHFHNDLGMAAANAVAAAGAGAVYIDTTVGGIGERAGNCSMTQLLTAVHKKYDFGMELGCANELETEFRSRWGGDSLEKF
ncbi:MAG: hypothetical protein ACK5MN_12580 [Lachnospiraceae bacterium]